MQLLTAVYSLYSNSLDRSIDCANINNMHTYCLRAAPPAPPAPVARPPRPCSPGALPARNCPAVGFIHAVHNFETVQQLGRFVIAMLMASKYTNNKLLVLLSACVLGAGCYSG